MIYRLFFILLLVCGPVGANCPPLPEQPIERQRLLADLANAADYNSGQEAIGALWMFWRSAPDELSQGMLDDGLDALRYADYVRAIDILTRLVRYCPNYAEGHNQLAYALFLQEKDDQALVVLKRALALEPSHFGVLSGIGLIHFRAQKPALGKVFIRRAVAINPWLNERGLLDTPDKNNDL